MSVAGNWREMPRRYRLEAEKCAGCGKVFFPGRLVCPECHGRNFETVRLSQEGTLLTYTVIHVGPNQFADQTPYAMGIVELDEGVRFQCQVADCEIRDLRSGMPVKIEFRRISQEGDAGIINYGYKCVPL